MNEEKLPLVIPFCTCTQDVFADLPVELRPKLAPKRGGLRKITCPGCSLVYWTNRITDLCIECEKRGVSVSQNQKEE